MMEENWNTASLRIGSKTMSAAQITDIMGVKPTQSYEKGTPLSSRNPKSAVRDETLWIKESGLDSSVGLNTHIASLISLIENKVDIFKELLPNCHIEIFCGFASQSGQGGFVLDAALLKRLTLIPLDITLDLYPSVGDKSESNSQPVESKQS